MWKLTLTILLLATQQPTFGQYPMYNPYAPIAPAPPGPREKRARREQAVAYVGPVARSLVETYGEDAVAALFTCSPSVGRRLAEFHNAGELAKLPRPADLLRVIGQPGNGDDVAVWAMQPEHARVLADVASFDAYLLAPLEHALGLKDLAGSAAEVRAQRLGAPPPSPPGPQIALPAWLNGQTIAAGLAGLGIVVLLIWRKRQQS